MVINLFLNQIEIREELVAQQATVFNKIFYWRSKNFEEHQFSAKFTTQSTEDKTPFYGMIPCAVTKLELEIQHSAYMINLDTHERMLKSFGHLFDLLSFRDSCHTYLVEYNRKQVSEALKVQKSAKDRYYLALYTNLAKSTGKNIEEFLN